MIPWIALSALLCILFGTLWFIFFKHYPKSHDQNTRNRMSHSGSRFYGHHSAVAREQEAQEAEEAFKKKD